MLSSQLLKFVITFCILQCGKYVESATVLAPPQYGTTKLEEARTLCAIEEAEVNNCTTTTLRHFTLQLGTELEPDERVGLTGDAKALGDWQMERSVDLHAMDNKLQWRASVMLQDCYETSYRYFIYIKDKDGHKQIRRWETHLKPRILEKGEETVDRFGEITAQQQEQQQQQLEQVHRGWLTHESIVQLKFEREKMFQVKDVEKFDPENVLIKIVPLKDDLETALEPSEVGINIEVVKHNYGESLLQPQQSFGISHTRGDIVIFHLTVSPSSLLGGVFALIFHTPERTPMGKAIIKTSDLLQRSEGLLQLTITEPGQHANIAIAHLTLPFLIVKPFNEIKLDFRTTYAHYWPKSWPNFDVGHRGNGRSYVVDPPAERENTVASFRRAYESFADMIELDVHLTSDNVPIIYHDFGVHTAPPGKHITSPSQLTYVLIKDLSYEAVKRLRVFAVINNEAFEYPGYNAEPRTEHRIFPSLVDIFQALPKTLGIDVEIKWPQLQKFGGVESSQTIDKNIFVDRVLNTVITHGCGRPLIFSSFDADICTMLRFKQNLLPVMFLTQGETKKWQPFLDLRTRTFEQAINNAQAFELAGTAAHAEDFLDTNGAQLMQKSRNLRQIALVWGDDCNSVERVKYFREIGATAVCYDRLDLNIPEGKQRSFFNSTNLIAEFEGQCGSMTGKGTEKDREGEKTIFDLSANM